MPNAPSAPWVLLRSTAAWEVGYPVVAAIEPHRDVVATLARKGRYNDQSVEEWSVAAHAVVCYRLARAWGYGPEAAWACLHHDDGEALTGDVSAPVKAWLAAYSPEARAALHELERTAQLATWGAWGRAELADHHVTQVRRADLCALAGERDVVMPADDRPWYVDDPAVVPVEDRALARDLVRLALRWRAGRGVLAAQDYLVAHAEAERALGR